MTNYKKYFVLNVYICMERITSILFAYDPILNRLKPFTKTIEGEILDELSFRCFGVKPYFTVVNIRQEKC